jgi:phospholipase D1/2
MVERRIDQEEPMRDRSMRDGSVRNRTQLSMIHESSMNGEFEDADAADMESQGSNADSVSGVTRRRSAALFSHRAYKERKQLLDDMQHVRSALGDTYQVDGEKILLHGYLHIQIIRARGLRNADLLKALFYNPLTCNFRCDEASDSYVTVHAGADRLLKTKVIDDDLNPEWNQDWYLPICHYLTELEFRVKDWDDFGSEDLGEYRLSVHELIQFGIDEDDQVDISVSMQMRESIANFNSNDKNIPKIPTKLPAQRLLRRGVHKTVFLDGRPSHGSLEFIVDFIPKDLLHKPPRALGVLTKKSPVTMEVPGVYFPMRQNNRVRFYINADDKGTAPPVPYSYGDGQKQVWKPQRFFRDIYDSWCAAKHMIYVVGWSVDYTISLLRGQEEFQGLNHDADGNPYSPKIGELLNQKASEGVVVNLLVWDDNTSNSLKTEGAVATRDEELRLFFKDSMVNLRLVPMGAGDANMFKRFRNSVYYTHHQKCVICDTPQKELVAYVGKFRTNFFMKWTR